MKNEEAHKVISALLEEKQRTSAQEIYYATKGKIPNIQTYTIMKKLILVGAVQLDEREGNRYYQLVNADNLDSKLPEKPTAQEEEQESEEEQAEQPRRKIGRDLTTYKFNGKVLNKGRLALEVIKKYAAEKNPSMEEALDLFPNELVPPYGMIQPIEEAKKMSKIRPRFFIKIDDEIEFRECNIAVSNQWTFERIQKLIKIAKKKLNYKIS